MLCSFAVNWRWWRAWKCKICPSTHLTYYEEICRWI